MVLLSVISEAQQLLPEEIQHTAQACGQLPCSQLRMIIIIIIVPEMWGPSLTF